MKFKLFEEFVKTPEFLIASINKSTETALIDIINEIIDDCFIDIIEYLKEGKSLEDI